MAAEMKARRQSIAGSGFGAAAIVKAMQQCQHSSTIAQSVPTLVVQSAQWKVSR
jgi:hypothetical protein